MPIGTRRRFIATLLGGPALLTASVAPAQRAGPRRVGVLIGLADDAEARARAAAFEDGLRMQDWRPCRDVELVYRYAAGDADRMRFFAEELVGRGSEVLLAHSTPVVREVLNTTKTVPVVFVVVADPVGSGFAASFARPGGNATVFTNLDSTITAKLLTILKQLRPNLMRVALMYNPDTVASGGLFYLKPFEAAAPSFNVKPVAAQVHGPAQIESVMEGLARDDRSGLIVMPDNFTTVHRELIISLAARGRVPTIYPYRYFAESGGLLSYGVDVSDLFRRSAEYVSRILRGAEPGALPVQAPTKFELVVNLRAAKALGLAVPRTLLVNADALID